MRLLLDTHIAIWAIEDSPKLPRLAHSLISERSNDVFVSVVSLWEIAIKYALRGRGAGAIRISTVEAQRDFTGAGYVILPILPAHVAMLETLPGLHGDPFDRMLIAQAFAEPLALLSADAKVQDYSPAIMRL